MRPAAALVSAALVLTGCSAQDQGPDATSSSRPAASASPSASAPSASRSASPTGTPRATPRATPSATSSPAPSPDRERAVRRARELVDGLSLPELAGQVIVARYAGTSAPTGLVRRLHLGGVIVMGDNVADTGSLRATNRRLRRSVRRAGRDWPVFIGVDQEGGLVERVQGRATRFPAFMSAGAADDRRLTRRAATASGAELAGLGFNVVFAPVADVTSGPSDPTIGSRSAGSRPRLVARHALAAVDGFRSAGVLPVLKHFPGHGSVPADSHEELPVQTRSRAALLRRDLVPFREGADHGVPAVMTGHIDVHAVSPGVPATWSRPLVTGLLRERLGFGGLVVTDAMEMAAVADRAGSGAAAVRALRAGNDVVLMPVDPAAARAGIVDAVRSGRLPRARLEQAARRMVAALLRTRAERSESPVGTGEGRAASYRLSAGAVTVVDGPCRGRLVGRSVRATGPDGAVRRFEAAARRAGLRVGAAGRSHVALVGYARGPATADVVVSLDTPYVLGHSAASSARIAVYGDTPGAMRSLVDVLLGRARAPGTLPVPVPGVPRDGCRDVRGVR